MESTDLWSLLQNYEQGTMTRQERASFLNRLIESQLDQFFPELENALLLHAHPDWTTFTEKRQPRSGDGDTTWGLLTNTGQFLPKSFATREEARITARELRALLKEKP